MFSSSLVSTRKRISGLCWTMIDCSWAILVLLLMLLQLMSRAFSFGLVLVRFLERLSGVEVFDGFGPKGSVLFAIDEVSEMFALFRASKVFVRVRWLPDRDGV